MICKDSEVFICDTHDTKSGRMYPLTEMQKVVEELNKSNTDILGGFVNSYSALTVDLSKVTHTCTNFKIVDNKVLCDVHILNTPYGIHLQQILKQGVAFKCSPRGSGIVQNGNIVSDYKLAAVDIELGVEE